MRSMVLLALLLFFSGCPSKESLNAVVNSPVVTSNCPEDGDCKIEVLKGKTLNLLHDDFGRLYPEIGKGENIVLIYEYKRHEIPDAVDDHYSELVYMELKPEILELELSNSELSQVKLVFGRLCYCKGQTGYYTVTEGYIQISKGDTGHEVNLNFRVTEVPQVITGFKEICAL